MLTIKANNLKSLPPRLLLFHTSFDLPFLHATSFQASAWRRWHAGIRTLHELWKRGRLSSSSRCFWLVAVGIVFHTFRWRYAAMFCNLTGDPSPLSPLCRWGGQVQDARGVWHRYGVRNLGRVSVPKSNALAFFPFTSCLALSSLLIPPLYLRSLVKHVRETRKEHSRLRTRSVAANVVNGKENPFKNILPFWCPWEVFWFIYEGIDIMVCLR